MYVCMYVCILIWICICTIHKSFQLWSWFCPIFASRSLNCDVQVPHASLVAVDWPILVLPSAPRYISAPRFPGAADDGEL